ncbi:MAG TPA: TonB-dependent receptor [Bryobacteraceae bacterium]
MRTAMTHKTVASLVLGIACLSAPRVSSAIAPTKFSGSIAGIVSDGSGIPQMGASVILYNKQERLFERVLTNEKGEFKFLGLFPDVYSVRVSLAAFIPAVRRNILVQPGMRSVLAVNLSTLFSSIQLRYPQVDNGSLMSDDWKWVLRSAPATRPVLRFAEMQVAQVAQPPEKHTAVFSDTRGILKVSAGEGSLSTATGNEADMGTAFALATSLYGNNMLQVSGNLGYGSQTGIPSAAFRTSYSRNVAGSAPEVSVTMRQLFLPGRLGAALAGSDAALPMLRSMSVDFEDHYQLTDELSLQYGISADSVTFLDHLNYLSPYARLAYAIGPDASVDFAYTSGNARPDLAGAARDDEDLQRDLNTLGLFPRISLRDAHAKIQRGEEYELGVQKKIGTRTWRVSAYRESVTNAALSMVAPAGFYASGDVLPDLFSGSSIFNAGNYETAGYTASVTQSLGEHVTATLMYGSLGSLTADRREIESNNPDELRSMIHAGRRHAATTRITAVSPWSGTHMIASYQWTSDHNSITPGNLYSTQSMRPVPGLNLYVRQPIPFSLLPWRMEATADLRNLLAQGYLPIGVVGGQQVLLVQTPRSFRGGLSFIF